MDPVGDGVGVAGAGVLPADWPNDGVGVADPAGAVIGFPAVGPASELNTWLQSNGAAVVPAAGNVNGVPEPISHLSPVSYLAETR